jgi:hypothetical protein
MISAVGAHALSLVSFLVYSHLPILLTCLKDRSGLIENITSEIDHALAQGLPSPGWGATHAPPHSLIIRWESLVPPFHRSAYVLKAPEEGKLSLPPDST